MLQAINVSECKVYPCSHRQKIIFQSMREEEKRIADQSVIQAEENERRRIAADLHDNMGAYAAAQCH